MAGIGIRMKSDCGSRQRVFSVSRVTPGSDTFPWEEVVGSDVVEEDELVEDDVGVDDGILVTVLVGVVRLWAGLLANGNTVEVGMVVLDGIDT